MHEVESYSLWNLREKVVTWGSIIHYWNMIIVGFDYFVLFFIVFALAVDFLYVVD
jgi:hypothetical protein